MNDSQPLENFLKLTLERYVSAFKQYATFSGRADKASYWTFIIISNIILRAFEERNTQNDLCSIIYLLVWIIILPPQLSILVRRFHDINKSGRWLFALMIMTFAPQIICFFYPKYEMISSLTGISVLLFIIVGLIPGNPEPNRYGLPGQKSPFWYEKSALLPIAAYIFVALFTSVTMFVRQIIESQ